MISSTTIFKKYYNMIYKVALNRSRNVSNAEDICQEVFLRYLKNEEKFNAEKEEYVKSWLIHVTINCFKKHRDSSWAKKTIYINNSDDESICELDNSLKYSECDEYGIENDIANLINQLPQKYELIVKLFYFDDLTVQQISEYIGLNENTVKTRLRRAKDMLRDRLEEMNLGDSTKFLESLDKMEIFFQYYKDSLGSTYQKNHKGIGKKAAILNIDLANMWTQSGSPFSCDVIDEMPNIRKLNRIAREMNEDIPIIFCITDFFSNKNTSDTVSSKFPVTKIDITKKEYLYALDYRLDVCVHDHVLWKPGLSCFRGTILNYILHSMDVDTIIITGVTASGAIRLTAMEADSLGYRVIVPKDAISDRIKGAKGWNLFDIEVHSGEVETTEKVIEMLKALEDNKGS